MEKTIEEKIMTEEVCSEEHWRILDCALYKSPECPMICSYSLVDMNYLFGGVSE